MPRAATNKTQKRADGSKLLVLKYGRKRVLVPRPKSYRAAVEVARRHFSGFSRSAIALQTNEFDICGGELVDIAPESYTEVIDTVSSISVVDPKHCDFAPLALDQDLISASGSSAPPLGSDSESTPPQDDDLIQLRLCGERMECQIYDERCTTIDNLIQRASKIFEIPVSQIKLQRNGETLKRDKRAAVYLAHGDTVEVIEVGDRKPKK